MKNWMDALRRSRKLTLLTLVGATLLFIVGGMVFNWPEAGLQAGGAVLMVLGALLQMLVLVAVRPRR